MDVSRAETLYAALTEFVEVEGGDRAEFDSV